MSAKSAYDPLLVKRPRTDLGETLSKNFWEGLVKFAWEFARSVTKTSSKVCEPKIYNEAINNAVYGNR